MTKRQIAIIGAGFTGLTIAFRLAKIGYQTEVFEKDDKPGGLAVGFSVKGWSWPIEKHYHHLFTNDWEIINLIKELGMDDMLIFPHSLTSIFYDNKIYPFNSPQDILNFAPLPFPDRLRLGLVSAYLKILPKNLALNLENTTAVSWLKKYYGGKIYDLVWNPLLSGKFGTYRNLVNMAWFWARIKKRTLTLGYIRGGFQALAGELDKKIRSFGGNIYYHTAFDPQSNKLSKFDKIIVTTPTSIFLKLFPQLSKNYSHNLRKIPHLHALNLLIIAKKQFFPDRTYWLNINDRRFPFIAVVEHTNFIDPKYYGGNHLIYVGNYLPPDHPYLKMSKEELYKLYLPFLKKINPEISSKSFVLGSELFFGPFAQPVFPLNYSGCIPSFSTPIPNVYLANMDMVYPWDRGTNYAVELGNKVANLINQS